ncbi:MAG: GNAT family N-acetyltransferase [Actinobacteria bacterium]|nr:GNAT family N-acetyltransferase [Actinomycetota bacterium]
MASADWTTRRAEPRDRDAWQRLFTAYCNFYEREVTGEHLDRVWSWIHDEGLVDAFVVESADGDGQPVGIAHLRSWVRSLRGEMAGYLDDLFVEPDHRGSGAVDALFEAIRELGAERGWNIVRWTTADDNYRARGYYDRVASRTGWLTYELTLSDV